MSTIKGLIKSINSLQALLTLLISAIFCSTSAFAQAEGEPGVMVANCFSRGGLAVVCSQNCAQLAPNVTPLACAETNNNFTPELFAAFEAQQMRAGQLAVVRADANYAKSNKGYQVGFLAELDRLKPTNDGQGNYNFTEAELKLARENGDRLGAVFAEKRAALRKSIEESLKLSERSAAFREAFNRVLTDSAFEPAYSTKDGKVTLEAQVSPNMLRKAGIEAALAEGALAKDELSSLRAEIADLKAQDQNLRNPRSPSSIPEEDACQALRSQRDREFLSSEPGSVPNSSVRFEISTPTRPQR